MVKIDELRKALEIDKFSLDEELVRQPSLFFTVAEAYVEAAAERDVLKEQLAVTDAELDGEVRQQLEQDGEKTTEAVVKGKVQSHKKHEAAFQDYVDAKTKADTLAALKEAFQMRGYLLRDLCSLAIADYFGADSVKATPATDTAKYRRQRERLAEGRR